MFIRQENYKDHKAVYQLVTEAFATAEHADGNEQDLVVALRKGNAFIPELSLVAEHNGTVMGHILFTHGKVGMDDILVLAPLSVKPCYQKQGVGTALMREGHKIAKRLGYQYSLVLGSESYYPRTGYIPAEQFGIIVPVGVPTENFMAIKLQEDAKTIGGTVTYAKEFGI